MSNTKKSLADNVVFRYLRESKEELGKITWPTRQESNKYAALTVAISLGIGVFFFVLDLIFTRGLSALIQLAS